MPASKNKHVFILMSGLGLGNATREWALIEALRQEEPSIDITVFTWGKALRFFRDELGRKSHISVDLVPLFPLTLSADFLPYVVTMFIGLLMLPLFVLNLIHIAFHAFRARPNVIIFDSDYHIFPFLTAKGIRVSVSQAPDVMERSCDFGWRFLLQNGFLSSYLIEWFDFQWQRILHQYVFVPVIVPKNGFGLSGQIFEVPLIVRKEFRRFFKHSPWGRPAVLPGGSGIEKRRIANLAQQERLEIHWPFLSKGRQKDPATFLAEFNPVVLQGGLSSLSECLALSKTVHLVPIERHWEQFLNAREVEKLGVTCSWKELRSNASVSDFQQRVRVDGADVIARRICEFLTT